MKKDARDLAVLGGAPAFAEPLHVNRPNVGDRGAIHAALDAILDRQWHTNDGPCVHELERRIGELLEVGHCVLTCNGTSALQIICEALGLRGEVVCPAFTFVATAHALAWQRLRPVFCDVDPRTHTADPVSVERCLGARTSAVVGVHTWGQPCDIAALTRLTAARSIPLVFDAAHAFGTSYAGRRVGGFGAAEAFSFHATKFFGTFEGGAVTTNDASLAKELRMLRDFGFAGYDRLERLGINAKMNEFCAAVGLVNLDHLDGFVATNRANLAGYRDGLQGLQGVRVYEPDPASTPNCQYVVVEVDEVASGVSRDVLLRVLHAENVLARRYFHPGCHRLPPYAEAEPDAAARLPVTERLIRQVLVLPNGTSIGEEEVAGVCEILRCAVDGAAILCEAQT